MLVIFGLSRKERVLAALPYSCGTCGHAGPQVLAKRSRRFTLFFVPVLPLGSHHEVSCRWCGASRRVGAGEARRLATAA